MDDILNSIVNKGLEPSNESSFLLVLGFLPKAVSRPFVINLMGFGVNIR